MVGFKIAPCLPRLFTRPVVISPQTLHLVAVSSKAGAWCPNNKNDQQWLKIDLGVLTTVTKVATQGRQDSSQWVTSYFISYSINNSYWANCTEDGEKKVKGK